MSELRGLLGDGEQILVTARRHPLFLVGRLILFVLSAIILIGVGIWVAISYTTTGGVALWALSLIPLGFLALRYFAWFKEVYAVTNYRIIQVEGVFSRRILDSSLEMVNDILLTQSLIGRMLNYGTIEIITGSESGLNKLDALKAPFDFKRAILDARNDLADYGHGQVREDRQTQLLDALQNLRSSGVLSEAEYEIKRSRLIGRQPE